MKYQDIQYFELEKPLALHDALLTDDEFLESSDSSSSSSSSFPLSMTTENEPQRPFRYWFSSQYSNGYSSDGTRVRSFVRCALVALVGLFLLLAKSSSPSNATTPPISQDSTITSNSNSALFDIQDENDPRYCVINRHHHQFDVGFMPYATEMDRSHCEEFNSHLRWSQDLRCYSLQTKWCFVTLDDGFSIQELEFHHHGCQVKFYEKNDGKLYHYDGRQMPESFQMNNCQRESESHIWYSIQPKTGCGKVPLRFCREDGSVHWDLVHLHKHVGGTNALSEYQYNCREFQLIDLMDDGSEDTSQIKDLCQEQVQGCANRLYRGCDGDGTINQELISNDEGECLQFDESDSNLAGYKTDHGVDLICLAP